MLQHALGGYAIAAETQLEGQPPGFSSLVAVRTASAVISFITAMLDARDSASSPDRDCEQPWRKTEMGEPARRAAGAHTPLRRRASNSKQSTMLAELSLTGKTRPSGSVCAEAFRRS
eukprot:SM000001S04663  [mRNA]  locus=s1:1538922:1539576:- [translate_table: standard]